MKYSHWLLILTVVGKALADDGAVEVITLHHRPATDLLPLLQPLLNHDERIIDNGFSLIVKAPTQRISQLRSLIQQLDIRQRNLLISVLQNSHQSAAELNSQAAIAIDSHGIQMQGNHTDTRDLANQRNLQQLRTLDGQSAHIETGEQQTIETPSVYYDAFGSPVIGYSTQLQQASSGFSVIPRLVGNQEVVVDIEPWAERFLRGGIEQRNAATSIRARLGEWIEISGSDLHSQQTGYRGMNQQSRDQQTRTVIKVEVGE